MASGENNDRLTLDIMRGIVERLQAAHAPLGGRLDALVSAACSDGMAATKDGRIITVAEMCRDDLVDQPPLTIARIDPTPGYCPPKETGGFMMTGENFDSFTLDEKRSLGLVSGAPEVNRFQAVGAISSLPDRGGCPKRDAVPFVREAMVTPEMIDAAMKAGGGNDSIDEYFALIYRAMHAVAPVELVPEGEQIAVRERDGWKELHRNAEALRQEGIHQIMRLRDDLAACNQHHERYVTMLDATISGLHAEMTKLHAQLDEARKDIAQRYTLPEVAEILASRDARIAELDSELARRPAAKVEGPKATPNAFREFARDHRRIGG